jgi:ABC-2 type transport system ATP-binding protein
MLQRGAPLMPDIQVRNLRKRYGDVTAVEDVSFEINGGEIFGLLGPNGAGKTSALECIIGLRVPDGGSIEVCGLNALRQSREVKQRIGAQLQATALQDKITPREALRMFAAFYHQPANVEGLIERFSLKEKADARFETLSGGGKQRLGLALAFVNEPRVVFLDEPTSGLDPQSRRELHHLILQMRAEKRSVLLTTHYIEEAQTLCDRIAIIDHGRLIATGTPAELVAGSKALPRVSFRAAQPVAEAQLRALPSVRDVVADSASAYRLQTTSVTHGILELVRLLEAQKNELLDLQVQKPSLEDVFIELTGTSLRE